MQYTCCPWTVGHLPQLWSRQQQRGAGTVIGGLLLFALGALLTASYSGCAAAKRSPPLPSQQVRPRKTGGALVSACGLCTASSCSMCHTFPKDFTRPDAEWFANWSKLARAAAVFIA